MSLKYSQNYLDKYLEIKVLNDKTIIEYYNNDTLSLSHNHEIGMKKIDEEFVSKFILSDWISHFIEVLHKISLYDRVPHYIYLSVEKYPSLFEKKIKEKNTYSQFYLDDDKEKKNIHVIIKKINNNNFIDLLNNSIIDKNSKQYERYTKTISQFKY